LARCDNCGDGWTALERKQRQVSETRAIVERVLSELADDCPVCWTEGRVSCKSQRGHSPQRFDAPSDAGICLFGREGGDLTKLNIRFDQDIHSCFRCGLSQRFCNTGQSTTVDCQWPNIASPMLRTIRWTRRGGEILEQWGFFEEEAADGHDREYLKWLGRRHPRRVLQEVVSNGFALLVEFISRQHRETDEVCPTNTHETDEDVEDWGEQTARAPAPGVLREGSLVRHGDDGNRRALEPDEMVRRWERGCIVCRVRGRDRDDHVWRDCRVDLDNTEAVNQGVRLINSLQAPLRATGFRC